MMEVHNTDPSVSPCRRRHQTSWRCYGKELWCWAFRKIRNMIAYRYG